MEVKCRARWWASAGGKLHNAESSQAVWVPPVATPPLMTPLATPAATPPYVTPLVTPLATQAVTPPRVTPLVTPIATPPLVAHGATTLSAPPADPDARPVGFQRAATCRYVPLPVPSLAVTCARPVSFLVVAHKVLRHRRDTLALHAAYVGGCEARPERRLLAAEVLRVPAVEGNALYVEPRPQHHAANGRGMKRLRRNGLRRAGWWHRAVVQSELRWAWSTRRTHALGTRHTHRLRTTHATHAAHATHATHATLATLATHAAPRPATRPRGSLGAFEPKLAADVTDVTDVTAHLAPLSRNSRPMAAASS